MKLKIKVLANGEKLFPPDYFRIEWSLFEVLAIPTEDDPDPDIEDAGDQYIMGKILQEYPSMFRYPKSCRAGEIYVSRPTGYRVGRRVLFQQSIGRDI